MIPALVTPPALLLLTAVVAYLIGTVSFGLIMARVYGLGDLRKVGSGNIGATNVLRTGNKKAAALTLLLDALKGVVAVLLARAALAEDAAQVAALACFVGHCYPVWLRFRGGKGVATFLGVLLALAFPLGLAACAIWALTARLSRYSSLSAAVAALSSPVLALLFGRGDLTALCILLAALLLWRHQTNIRRLIAGTEPKIGQKT